MIFFLSLFSISCITISPRKNISGDKPQGYAMTASSKILQQWEGVILLQHESNDYITSPSIIQNAKEYDQLIAQLPKRRIQKRQPAPPNDDPLIKRPDIDFHQHTLIVIRSDNWTEQPKVIDIVAENHQHIIRYIIPINEHNYMMAQPSGVGRYLAILIAKTDARIKIEESG